MSKSITERSRMIRGFLLDSVRIGRQEIVSTSSKMFNISRQSIHRHLAALIKEGRLIATGHTRARTYSLGPVRDHVAKYQLKNLKEDVVHREDFSFLFEGLPENISEICHYGFTEILNNAIDHSEGSSVTILTTRSEERITIQMHDDGEGIFKRIARLCKLPDPRESILELSKGKLTTDPENHTGQGIFFSSRSFDSFYIRSGDLCFAHKKDDDEDFLLHVDETGLGTSVYMDISLSSSKDLGHVFDEYSGAPDDYRFYKTVVPVRLAIYEGEALVSRSQAKRILNRVEKFQTVILDFAGVDKIGQAFSDEVFRVFTKNHPKIKLIPINTTSEVDKMVSRAKSEQ